jgi:tRNA1Val (adenine37-N6)-methyltransferase
LAEYTAETFFKDQIKIFQPETGYRYSMDPVILAYHISPFKGCKVIDIGCGCGIIPLILGFRYKDIQIFGIEIQDQLAEIAKKNINENQMSDHVWILNKDIKAINSSDTQGLADIIISNPPYKKKGSGRLNPDIQKAVARHEIHLDLEHFFLSANSLLKPKGQVLFIFPAERLSDLILAMHCFDFHLDWIRFIHTKKKNKAKLILISGIKNSHGSCTVRPPLYIYDSKNNPTNEYTTMFKP